MNRQAFNLALGVAAALLLTAGVAHLFTIRFQSGDIYPPYSSLRTDPLGAKALYESLARCPGITAERSYMPPEKLATGSGAAILFLGDTMPNSAGDKIFSSESVGAINTQMRKGARIVITIMPRNTKAPEKSAKKHEREKKPGKNQEKETKEIKLDKADTKVSIHDWLGINYGDFPFYGKVTATLDRAAVPQLSLPQSLSCHTSLCFTNIDATWNVIYRHNGQPVIIEREFGKGSIVLSALTYFVSNEAMRDERYPALVSWLIGPNRRIIFDEYHHGIAGNPGVSSLVRKYRMHWLAAGLAILAGLFIWRNSISLVPPHAPQPGDTISTSTGKDSTSGLINLLRRNIPQSAIINACVVEWKKALRMSGHEEERKLLKIQELARRESEAGQGRHRQVEIYNEICRILRRQK